MANKNNKQVSDEFIKKIAMNDKKIKKIISNKTIKRTVFVPKKIINIVL